MKKKSLNKKKRDVNTGLLDSLPLPAFIIGFNKGTFSDFLYVNPAFCHMIGYMREEMAGIKFNDICAYSGYVKAGFSKRNKSKTNIIRVVLIKKDKNRIPVELHVSSIKYNGKNSLLVLAIDRRENIIAEQTSDEVLKMHLMRAEMWKLSACGCGEESELVEKIFSIIGPGLDASRLVFSALQGDSLIAISEWTAPGIRGNMKGIKIPKQIFDAFKFTGQIVLDKSGIIKIFPEIIRPVITKIVDMLIKIAGEKPVLITPYFVDGHIQGVVSATGLSEPVTLWSEVKKGLLKETASVIATTIMINRQRKKKAEDENKFRAIMENIKGVFVRHYLNEDRVEMNYNEAYRQLLGFPEGYFDTNSMVKYRELVHPEDLERVEKISDDGARNKSSYYQEYRIRNISDNYIWVAESVAVMRNEKGEPVWTDNFIFDISAKKNNEIKLRETEEKFTAAFMKNPEYMSLTRLSDSVIVEANESFASRFGYKIEEIIGKTTVELGMWADPLDRQKWLQSLNEKKESLGYEVMLKDRYGKFFYALLSAVMIEISGEKYMLTVARDITDIKEAQKKLKESLDEVRKSGEEMERFAYVASHDLQEPLRMVSNYIQLLERRYKDIVDNDGREFIGYAVEGAKRMQSMIKDLLVFSRAGSRPLELKKTSLESVAAQAIKNLQETVSEKGAVINTYNLPFVECDEMQMIQLFQNILDNALKFSKKGTTPVIEIKSEKKEGSYIISFRDNGIGIEKKYHDKIFVIFNRLHSRQEYPGSGIGLAVCKKIAEKHKGRITVDSEPGSGSVFSLILPENISDNKQV